MELMLLASLLFLGTHLGISSTALRGRLVDMLGEGGFLIAYSVMALITLSYLIWIYGAVPRHEYFWLPDPQLRQVPKVLMPVAMILLVGGFMVRNPTAVGQEALLRGGAEADALTRGVTRITRHPFQWAVAIWAATHLIANGDRVSVVFFGTFLVLGLAGGVLIDRKKAAKLGADWQPFARVTSNLPFAAIITGRNRLALRELVAPVLAGLAVYVLAFWLHPWLSGVRII
ncbi:MAG: NnrU family protein [Pseudomonadales bacterium]